MPNRSAPKKSMRPRSRSDSEGMSPKVLEDSTKSPNSLNMDEKAARAKKIDRAQLSAGRRKTLELMDSRLPGASKEKNEEKQGLLDLLDMLDGKKNGGMVKKGYMGGGVVRVGDVRDNPNRGKTY